MISSKIVLCIVAVVELCGHSPAVGLSYQEIFRDDFNGGSIDEKKWNRVTAASQVNEELQYYTADEAQQRGGQLVLSSHQRPYGGRQYTSGRVDTRHKFNFTYGEVEWKAKLPKGKLTMTLIFIKKIL